MIFEGCATDGSITSTDQSNKYVRLETTSDPRSAMPDLNKRSDVDTAEKSLKTTLKEEPRNVSSLLNLAQIKLGQGRLKEAEAYVQKALRIDLKNKLAKKTMAQIYLRRKNYEMTTIIINGLGGASSKDPDILNMLAQIALHEDRKPDALALFQKGLDLDRNNVSIRMNLGVLHLSYRQLDRAAAQFERVLKIMPGNNDAKLHLAVIYAAKGDRDQAENSYEEILASDSNNPLALYNLAVLNTQKKNFSDASVLLKRYLNTPYAKKSANDEVYALLEEIDLRQRQQRSNESAQDINSLADKINSSNDDVKENPMAKDLIIPSGQDQGLDEDIKALQENLE